jgi:hypothetical protein
MNNEDFVRVMKEAEMQLLEISGCLTISEGDEFTRIAAAKVVTLIHGLRIIYGACEQPKSIHNQFLQSLEHHATWGQ